MDVSENVDPAVALGVVVDHAYADGPRDLVSFVLHCRVVGDERVEVVADYTRPNGSVTRGTPRVGRQYLFALRRSAYVQGKGTWFSARIELTPERRFVADYDFDSEPQFTTDRPTHADYLHDAARYPRDDEHTPGWLRQKLLEALP